MTHRQRYNVYIAACAEDGGIYRYAMDETGALTFRDKTDIPSPMYLSVSGGKLTVLLRSPFGSSQISGYTTYDIAPDGSLSNRGETISTLGIVACHHTVWNGRVYAVNYSSGSVFASPDTLVRHEGHGPNPARQEMAHTHYVMPTPDGRYLFVVDLGLDSIFTYDGDLREVSRVSAPPGAGPRHLIYSPDGKLVYCLNEMGSSVSVYAYGDGALTLLDTYPALPGGFTGSSTGAAIRYESGCIYASNRGHDSIARFRCEGEKLIPAGFTPCGGKSPRDFNIIGGMLLCTNESSDNVTLFRMEDGVPVKLEEEFHMPHPLCVIGTPVPTEV